jgi:hypothetical protein
MTIARLRRLQRLEAKIAVLEALGRPKASSDYGLNSKPSPAVRLAGASGPNPPSQCPRPRRTRSIARFDAIGRRLSADKPL